MMGDTERGEAVKGEAMVGAAAAKGKDLGRKDEDAVGSTSGVRLASDFESTAFGRQSTN